MRILKILLLSMVVALAGCADDDADGATQPPAGDGGALPGDGADGGEGNATPDDGANETAEEEEEPAPPAPVEVYNTTHSFQGGDATGAATVDETATVPEGHATVQMNVTFMASQESPTLNNDIGVTLVDPAGTEVGSCTLAAGPQTSATACDVTGPAVAGDYIVRYSGAGTTSAQVTLVAI